MDVNFQCLEKVEYALFRAVPKRIQPFIPQFVSDLCYSYRDVVGGALARIRRVLHRELRAVVETPPIEFRTANPLATAIIEIDPESVSELREVVNSLCLTATKLVVFEGFVLQLLLAAGTPQLASEWLNHFWKLLIREITPALYPKNFDAIKHAIALVNSSHQVIDVLTDRYELGATAILPHREVLQVFAEILQRGEFEESGKALVTVMKWITKN
jgi:hypothetical protein